MSSIKDGHWFGSNYVFDDCLGYLKRKRVQLELRCVTDDWNQGGARSAAVLKRRGVHEKMGSRQSVFNHFWIDQQRTTSHSPYTVEIKKRSFDVSDLEGANDGFFAWTGIKTSSWQFSFLRELRLVPVPSSIKTSSPFLLYISFTTSSRFALLRRFITGNSKPCYSSHIFRNPWGCEPSSKRPKRPPMVCLFFTEVL